MTVKLLLSALSSIMFFLFLIANTVFSKNISSADSVKFKIHEFTTSSFYFVWCGNDRLLTQGNGNRLLTIKDNSTYIIANNPNYRPVSCTPNADDLFFADIDYGLPIHFGIKNIIHMHNSGAILEVIEANKDRYKHYRIDNVFSPDHKFVVYPQSVVNTLTLQNSTKIRYVKNIINDDATSLVWLNNNEYLLHHPANKMLSIYDSFTGETVKNISMPELLYKHIKYVPIEVKAPSDLFYIYVLAINEDENVNEYQSKIFKITIDHNRIIAEFFCDADMFDVSNNGDVVYAFFKNLATYEYSIMQVMYYKGGKHYHVVDIHSNFMSPLLDLKFSADGSRIGIIAPIPSTGPREKKLFIIDIEDD